MFLGALSVCLMQANCLMLLFAAHDTVASTLALLLRFLKQTPEALQKLRAEQRQVTNPLLAPIKCMTCSRPNSLLFAHSKCCPRALFALSLGVAAPVDLAPEPPHHAVGWVTPLAPPATHSCPSSLVLAVFLLVATNKAAHPLAPTIMTSPAPHRQYPT